MRCRQKEVAEKRAVIDEKEKAVAVLAAKSASISQALLVCFKEIQVSKKEKEDLEKATSAKIDEIISAQS